MPNNRPIPVIEYQLLGDDYIEPVLVDPASGRGIVEEMVSRLFFLVQQGATITNFTRLPEIG